MPTDNTIKKNDLARIREQEFALMFGESIKKLMEALGVTRKVAKTAGTVLKTYKAVGTLESGNVAEGEIIPLSKYKTVAINWKEITLKKWRKSTTAEAIIDRGFDQAVTDTTDRMLKDVQGGIRKDFFDFLATTDATIGGTTFQAAIAQAWGQLQILFEDDNIQAVYFMNPLDIADYLSSATISTQTAFGFTYVKDFLGMGTAILNSSVPKGTVYATAADNIILYYISVNGADLDEAFSFTTDESGYVGIHEHSDYTDLTAQDTVVSGIELMAERIDGIIKSSINGSYVPTTGISISGTTTVAKDSTTTLTATKTPNNSTDSVVWRSSDESTATVSSSGVVTGKAAGKATITATAGGASKSVIVTVSENPS